MVGAKGIEPLASSASRKRSPTELRAYRVNKITFYSLFVQLCFDKENICSKSD